MLSIWCKLLYAKHIPGHMTGQYWSEDMPVCWYKIDQLHIFGLFVGVIFLHTFVTLRHGSDRMATESSACLQCVRFGLMSEQDLLAIRDSELIKRCPVGQQLVAKGYHYHMDSKKGGSEWSRYWTPHLTKMLKSLRKWINDPPPSQYIESVYSERSQNE